MITQILRQHGADLPVAGILAAPFLLLHSVLTGREAVDVAVENPMLPAGQSRTLMGILPCVKLHSVWNERVLLGVGHETSRARRGRESSLHEFSSVRLVSVRPIKYLRTFPSATYSTGSYNM